MHQEAPKNPEIATQLGNAYYDTRQFEQAKQMYELVRESKPNDPGLLTDLGVCYRNLGNIDKAISLFEKASSIAPEHWQSRYNQAVVYSFEKKNLEKARRIIAELKKDPNAAPAATQLEQAIEAHSGLGSGLAKPAA